MKKLIFLPFLTIVLLLSSCLKPGCTDPEAINFNPDANDEDKSCKYEGSVAFWFDEETSNNLTEDGVVYLIYYFNYNQLAIGSETDFSLDSLPECGAAGVVSQDMEMLVAKKSYSYKVTDTDENVLWSGMVEIEANKCKRIKLEL